MRLTLDVYRVIWDQAAPWLRNAMDLSLVTLLRREDVVTVKFADVRDGYLWVVPSKTRGSTNVRLKIALAGTLVDIVARCQDDVVSPFVIHRLPEKARPSDMRARERVHHTQVLPEQLSRAFAKARDAAGVDGRSTPTFPRNQKLRKRASPRCWLDDRRSASTDGTCLKVHDGALLGRKRHALA